MSSSIAGGLTWDQAIDSSPSPSCSPQTGKCTSTPRALWKGSGPNGDLYFADPEGAVLLSAETAGNPLPQLCAQLGGSYQGVFDNWDGSACHPFYIKGSAYKWYAGNCGATRYANPDPRGGAGPALFCARGLSPHISGYKACGYPDYDECASSLPFVEVSPPESPPPCPDCQEGNPIYPLRGAKREVFDTGFRVGRLTLRLTYNSTRRLPLPSGEVVATNAGSLVLGELWSSNLHRRLRVQGSYQGRSIGVQVARGTGHTTTFVENGPGVYLPASDTPGTADTADQLIPISEGRYQYVDAAARSIETYDASGQLSSIHWAQGDNITLTYSTTSTPASGAPAAGYLIQARDNKGRTLNFTYNAGGRVTRITDVDGRYVALAYDAQDNLASLTWTDGAVRTYVYEVETLPWALTGVVDERAVRYSIFGYDAVGRAISTEHAGGVDRHSVTYGTPPALKAVVTLDTARQVFVRRFVWVAPTGVTLTGPNGQTSTVDTATIHGKTYLAGRTQSAGAGSAASADRRDFDANGKVVREDSPNGHRTCYVNDTKRRLEVARIEGLLPSQDCAAVTSAGAVLPAGSRRISTDYHPHWSLEARRAEPGKVTVSVYNGQPDPTNNGAVAACAPGTALLPDGKPIAVLCKRIEQATLDASGTSGLTALSTVAPEYANVSLLLHMEGVEGAGTFLDSSANPKGVTARGSVTTTTATSKFGSASMNSQGASRWLTVAHAPELDLSSGDFTIELWIKPKTSSTSQRVLYNKANSTGYYASLLFLDNANRLVFRAYDGANSLAVNLSGTTSLALNTWHHIAATRSGNTFTVWINGQPEATAGSAAILRSNANEMVSIGAFSDGGYGFDGWIDEVIVSKGVARYGSAFAPASAALADPNGNLQGAAIDTSVPARVWSYTYNQHGQVLTETDPRGKTTTYAYYSDTTFTGVDPDAVGHTIGDLKTVTNAAGHVTQYTHYDKAGRLRQSTDPNGVVTAQAYDLRGRLLSSTTGGQTTSYEYEPTGDLKKLTQPDGRWVAYGYDAARRLTSVSDSAGNSITYTLDNAGNRTKEEVKDPGGVLSRQLTRVYDALGRVQQTTGRE